MSKVVQLVRKHHYRLPFRSVLTFPSKGAAYVATKHGIIGLTKNTAAVYNKKNIRCVVILPGGMDTPIRETLNISNQEAWDITMKAAAVEPSISDVDDVAKCVLFYSSAHAKCCNGAVVTTDGGWLAF